MGSYQLHSGKFLSPVELEKLESLAKRSLKDDRRNALAILLLLKTGARATELLNILKTDLNDHNRSVYIRGLKNSYDREIPIPAQIYKELKEHCESTSGDKVFDFGYHRLLQIWKNYRPCPKTIHSTRHTAGINLYNRSKDIRLVQTFLGHKSINNTMVYLQYAYSQNELRKALGY